MKRKIVRICTVPIFFNIIYKGQFKYLSNFFDVIGISSYDKKHLNEIEMREGIRMEAITIHRKLHPLNDIAALLKIFFLLLREKPVIVHTHTPKAGLIGMIASFFAGVPIRIHTVEGMPFLGAAGVRRRILLLLEKVTYLFATKIYPNSNGLKEIIKELEMCNTDKLKVLANGSSNGVDFDFFSPNYLVNDEENKLIVRSSLNLHKDDVVFTFVGRIGVDKGIRELVDSFKNINAKEAKAKLLLVGPYEETTGKLTNSEIEFIKKHPDIISVGRHDDVRPYLKITDVFVFPSYREGFPNAVLEAGAMGLPCIVTNINGCNEIVGHNINGLVVEPKDAVQLEKAMLQLYKSAELRQKFSLNARKNIEDRYNRELIWEDLLNEYQTLLSKTV